MIPEMSTASLWLMQRMRASRPEMVPYALLVAWVLSMVTLPIARWSYGDDIIPGRVVVSTLLQAATVLLFLLPAWRASRVARVALVVGAAAWAVEFIGSRTGVPFGAYHYTDRLQPQLGGVPLLIPLAWLMMLPPAWAVASALTGRTRGLRFVAVSALAFTAWDLFLDPQMVGWGFWVWAEPSGYFGIPWLNFLGWLLASALLTWLARPDALPVAPLLFMYGVTWALETIGLIAFWGLPGPGIVGGLVMGAFLLLAVRKAGERAP